MADDKTVLLCGASRYFVEELSKVLLDAGYVPRLARDTTAATQRLPQCPPGRTVVALDLTASEIDAVAILSLVARQTKGRPPVIARRESAVVDAATVEQLKRLGVGWFFDATAAPHEVLFALRSLLAPPPSERRQARRAPASIAVRYRSGQDAPREGVLSDITEAGLFVQTEARYPLGAEVVASFRLPEAKAPIEATCEVVFSSPKRDAAMNLAPGMGLKFRQLADPDRDAIVDYCRLVLGKMPDTRVPGLPGGGRTRSG